MARSSRCISLPIRVGFLRHQKRRYELIVELLLMTATPAFAGPIPEQPTRAATVNYTGGSITATRGVLAAMFKDPSFISACATVRTDRVRKSYTRTPYVGGPITIINQSNWTEEKYPSQTKSIAAGGEPIQLKINGEWWSARLSGSHTDFMDFLCESADGLNNSISWRSARGTLYGPVAPSNS